MVRRISPLVSTVSAAVFASGGCHPPESVWNTTSYAVAADDWQGDFLTGPVRFRREEQPAGLLAFYLDTSAPPDDYMNEIRLFRVSDGQEVPGGMERGRRIDGRELVPTEAWPRVSEYSGFVASEVLEEGWYVAGFDARAYRSFGPIVQANVAHWDMTDWSSRFLYGVAYARLRIGSGVDWVGTYVDVRAETGTVDFTVTLSSRLSAVDLESTEVTVLRAGMIVSCTEAFRGEEPGVALGVECPGLGHGDSVELRLVSDRVGHPMGAMRPQEIVIDRARWFYAVAPELGLDVLRAAYGIEGGGA